MKLRMFFFFLFALLNFLPVQSVLAVPLPKICMILDKAGKDDHGYNESAFKGFESAFSSHLISSESRVFEAKDDAQIGQATRGFINSSCDLIIGVGVNVAEPMKKFALQHPTQKFTTIDYVVPGKNVRSVVYREDQGGFLMGAIAAMKSKTQKVGIIAGMDIPLIERFKVGFVAGAKYINPDIKIATSFVGVSVDGWNNPSKAAEIALSQYQQGVDIIFQAAGGSGVGIFNAAEKMASQASATKHFAIGCDSNQNWMKPGIILTSLLKNLPLGVLASIQDIREGHFHGGTVEYDVKNKGIDWSIDKYNQELFTTGEIEKINAIKRDIGNDKIVVPDYYKSKSK